MSDHNFHKLRDINRIDFGDNIIEITSSMEILLTLFQHDDDPEIIAACKKRLQEGILLLKNIGANNEVAIIKKTIKKNKNPNLI